MNLKLPKWRLPQGFLQGRKQTPGPVEGTRGTLSNINWERGATPETVSGLVSGLMEESPVEVYAMILDLLRDPQKPIPKKWIEGVTDVARLAARRSLRDPPLGAWSQQMNIKSDDYMRFISYHRSCRTRLVQFLVTGDLIDKTGTKWIWYNTKCGVCPLTPRSTAVLSGVIGESPATWWVEHWERVVGFLTERPCEEAFTDWRLWSTTCRDLARKCQACYEVAVKEYPRFEQEVREVIIDIIKSIELEIKL